MIINLYIMKNFVWFSSISIKAFESEQLRLEIVMKYDRVLYKFLTAKVHSCSLTRRCVA